MNEKIGGGRQQKSANGESPGIGKKGENRAALQRRVIHLLFFKVSMA